MVDLVDRNGRRWAVSYTSGAEVSLSTISHDDEAVKIGEVQITADERPQRAWLTIDGVTRLAHCVKVGDDWWVHLDGAIHVLSVSEAGASSADTSGGLTAPMPGKVLEVLVEEGRRVKAGQDLIVLEAMKMEHRISAAEPGLVASINFQAGEQVEAGDVLIEIESDEETE